MSMFDEMLKDVVPDGEPGFNTGEIVLLALTVILAVFHMTLNYNFISRMMPAGWEILGIFGLGAIDIAFFAWAYILSTSAATQAQKTIAWVMLGFSAVGMGLITAASLAIDTTAQTAGLEEFVRGIAPWLFTFAVFTQVVMGVLYHLNTPRSILNRRQRERLTSLQLMRAEGRYRADAERLKAAIATENISAQASVADLYTALAQKDAELQRLRQQVQRQRLQTIAAVPFAPNKDAAASVAPEAVAVSGNGYHPEEDFTTDGHSPFDE